MMVGFVNDAFTQNIQIKLFVTGLDHEVDELLFCRLQAYIPRHYILSIQHVQNYKQRQTTTSKLLPLLVTTNKTFRSICIPQRPNRNCGFGQCHSPTNSRKLYRRHPIVDDVNEDLMSSFHHQYITTPRSPPVLTIVEQHQPKSKISNFYLKNKK